MTCYTVSNADGKPAFERAANSELQIILQINLLGLRVLTEVTE